MCKEVKGRNFGYYLWSGNVIGKKSQTDKKDPVKFLNNAPF